jgi:phosphatidylglycerophosphate synthase
MEPSSAARALVQPPRRALATRNAPWARTLARRLARAGMRPNAVSMASVGCATVAALAFAWSASLDRWARVTLLAAAAVSVQLRLLCNLLDGMLAVEEGLRSKGGDVYNELPDRLADVLILVGAGYGARALPYGVTLGWSAAILALLTAYVRALAGSLGLSQSFIGPMAKQHRMFTLTVATLASIPEALLGRPPAALSAGLAAIGAGAIVTIVRRTRRLVSDAGLQ